MKVTKKQAGEGSVVLECTATAAEVDAALDAAQMAFAQTMGLQPQPGKTIAEVAEERMGIKNLDSVVESGAIEALVPVALDKKNLMPSFPPVGNPTSALKRGSEFSFTMEVALKPDYELTSYDPVEVTIAPFAVNEAEVDAQIEQMAQRFTTYEKAEDKAIEKGDSCLIAMECFEDGKPLGGLTTDGRTYTAGMGYMPDGFDEQIIGMRPGETKTFTFEGPSVDDDFNEVTQVVDATVTVKEVQREVVPTVDDEWLKANMPMYQSVKALRADITKTLEERGREQYENYKRQMVATELSKRFQGAIADEVYEAMRNSLVGNIRAGLQQQGKTWEDFVVENGGEQQFGMMLMLQVREMLVQGYALDAVFRHEGLSITDEDIDEACRAMNPQVPPRQIREQMEQSGRGFALRESAERLKANKWAVDHAIIHTQEA